MPNEAHRKKRSSDRQSNRGATYTCALRPFEIIQMTLISIEVLSISTD